MIYIMDIDQQIVGNVDEILNYPVEEGSYLHMIVGGMLKQINLLIEL